MNQPVSTPNGDPIMVARFGVPELPTTFVPRARLVRRLREGLRGPLVLVNGPAGAGKTLLVAQWFRAAAEPGSAAWLTVETSDNAHGAFWAYVLEALRYHGVPLPEHVRVPSGAEQVDHALLGELAAHLHERARPVVLVLDEYERITSPVIAAELHELLKHSGPGLRLLLVSRSEPLLPLHRYRAAGELTAIRAADLAFTPDEAVELFGVHGVSASPEAIHALADRMGGWAAGLRLAGLAAIEAADAEQCLRHFEAEQGTVADYLINEVFDIQSAETRDVLLRTCILNQIHPELANALSGRGDGARILADLHRANAFVAPVGHGWYRCHPLFAEVLRIRLRMRMPGLEAQLHARAACWLGARGQIVAAVGHAAEAADWEFAAELLVGSLAIGRLSAGRDSEQLTRLFTAMPSTTTGPAAELVRAGLALGRGEPDRALEHLDCAREAVSANDTALRYTAACLSVLAARLLGSVERARAAATEADALRPRLPAALAAAHPELSAGVLGDLGAALLWDGSFVEAGHALAVAAEPSEAPESARLRHESLGGLGLIALLDGRLARAEAHARAAIAEAEGSGLPPAARTCLGRLVLAEAAIDRDELDDADAQLRSAEAAANRRRDPMVAQAFRVTRSRLLAARGRPAAALEALGREAEPGLARSAWLADRAAAAASAAHLLAGRPEAAIAVLDDAEAGAPESAVAAARARLALGEPESALRDLDVGEPCGSRTSPVYVQALLTRAQALDALGDRAAAAKLVQRALAAACGERLRLPFRLAAPWLRRLLRAEPTLALPHRWLPAELRAPEASAKPAGEGYRSMPVESLSEREHDVLARAAQLMSTEEIAADLFVSVNTVKTHLKNINRKLATSRRGEAVRRARELHVL